MSEQSISFKARVLATQCQLKAPKNQRNKFGNYNYRSCEDILEAVKPICKDNNLMLHLSDKIVEVGGRIYVEATATLDDVESDQFITSTASAREADVKKGMDESQITGTASSYARKYALNGLFDIDDTKDADTNENRNERDNRSKKTTPAKEEPGKSSVYACAVCGRQFAPYTDKVGKTYSAEEVYEMAKRRNSDGIARCADCRKKMEGKQ